MTELMKVIIPCKLFCPYCGVQHVDEIRDGERWDRRAHTTHRCQACGEDFDVYVSGIQTPVDAGNSETPTRKTAVWCKKCDHVKTYAKDKLCTGCRVRSTEERKRFVIFRNEICSGCKLSVYPCAFMTKINGKLFCENCEP